MGEKRVELPSGGYAVLRDPQSVTARERKPLETDMARAYKTGNVDELNFADRLVALMVKEWSLPSGVPSGDVEALGDLPGWDLDALRVAVQDPATSPFLAVADSKPDPKGPTSLPTNSGGSDSTLLLEPVSGAPTSQVISGSISSLSSV